MEHGERDALGMLCEELPRLRDEISQHFADRVELLARIEREAAVRRPILPLLVELLGADQESTRQMLAGGLPGGRPGRADDERFACHDGACDRTAVGIPAGPPPICWVTGLRMERQ